MKIEVSVKSTEIRARPSVCAHGPGSVHLPRLKMDRLVPKQALRTRLPLRLVLNFDITLLKCTCNPQRTSELGIV